MTVALLLAVGVAFLASGLIVFATPAADEEETE